MNNSIKTAGRLDLKDIKGLCSKWPWLLATGLVFVFLGTLATATATFTTLYSMIFFGVLLLTAAIVYFVKAFWTVQWRGFFLYVLLGIFSAIVGVMMIANPKLSALSLTLLLGSFFTVTGFFKIINALAINFENWGWMLASGIISVLLGIIVLAQWPASSLWLIGTLIGVELIVTGWYSVMLAFAINRHACPAPHTPA